MKLVGVISGGLASFPLITKFRNLVIIKELTRGQVFFLIANLLNFVITGYENIITKGGFSLFYPLNY